MFTFILCTQLSKTQWDGVKCDGLSYSCYSIVPIFQCNLGGSRIESGTSIYCNLASSFSLVGAPHQTYEYIGLSLAVTKGIGHEEPPRSHPFQYLYSSHGMRNACLMLECEPESIEPCESFSPVPGPVDFSGMFSNCFNHSKWRGNGKK